MSENTAATPTAPEAATENSSVKPARSLASDAWFDLRRNPIFWVATAIVATLIVVAAFPSWFTDADPDSCELTRRLTGSASGAPFGYDLQGCDVFARALYGARSSITVGLFATALAGVIAFSLGMTAGFYGGWVDTLLSRSLDIVVSIPLLLASIVLLKRLHVASTSSGIWQVSLTLGILSWPVAARVVRSSVIAAKQQDYVQAARMLGAGNLRIMLRHILPNAMAPAIVVLTILLGTTIATEATLSFLGIGLKNTISWGGSISDNSKYIRTAAAPLLCPAGFLAMTVLAFIMLGDAIRDAFDPRMR